MQHELSTTLKQSVSTRWNSTFFMLKSICDNLEQLKTMTDRPLQKHLLDLNEELLKDAIMVLEHVDVATRLLLSDQWPTIHMVLAVRHRLLSNIAVADEDVETIKCLKSLLIQLLDSYYVINDFHGIAAIFDPRLKNNVVHGVP